MVFEALPFVHATLGKAKGESRVFCRGEICPPLPGPDAQDRRNRFGMVSGGHPEATQLGAFARCSTTLGGRPPPTSTPFAFGAAFPEEQHKYLIACLI
jgi:hypothetical protein